MPRYFFNLFNDITAIDDEGSDWGDDAGALAHALLAAREIASVSVLRGELNLEDHIEVLAEDRRHVGTVSFRDAVRILP